MGSVLGEFVIDPGESSRRVGDGDIIGCCTGTSTVHKAVCTVGFQGTKPPYDCIHMYCTLLASRQADGVKKLGLRGS